MLSLSSLGSHSTPHAPRLKKQPLLAKQPSSVGSSSCDEEGEVILVQPFRRSQGKAPPSCVPILDLSRFNEADVEMAPVRIRHAPSTAGTVLSWGREPQEEVSSGEATPTSQTTPTREPAINSSLDENQTAFIERKLLSNERGGANGFHGVARVCRVPESSLSKKLRFEARVQTQNGRDVHRELCGFYFLADKSVTVYEFRQFGRRSSALPVIKRGLYCRPGGSQYEIRDIKAGATLEFTPSQHPALPDTLAGLPRLVLVITFVDEELKKSLLTEGLNPVQEQAVVQYLAQESPPSRDEELLSTLQRLMAGRLAGRASRTLVGLGRELHQAGTTVNKQQLEQCLRSYHISLTVEDMSALWRAIGGNGGVSVDGLVGRLVGALPEERHAHIRKVFRKLDTGKSGSLSANIIDKFHSPMETHFRDTVGRRGCISYADFEHYYHGLSIETTMSCHFIALLNNCWSI